MKLNYQEHRTFRIMIIILIAVMIAMLIVVLLNKNEINTYVQRNIFKNPDYLVDTYEGCPSSLTIYHYVDPRGTANMSDDDFYIAVFNVDEVPYKSEVFVNEESQGELIIMPNSTSSIRSNLITDWWRKGFAEVAVQEEEQEDSIEEEDVSNKELFLIDIFIEGCNETVVGLTPSPPTKTITLGGGGGGGGDSSSPSSRYSLNVVKEDIFYLPD